MFVNNIYLVPVVELAREVDAHDVPAHRSHLVSHLKKVFLVEMFDSKNPDGLFTCSPVGGNLACHSLTAQAPLKPFLV